MLQKGHANRMVLEGNEKRIFTQKCSQKET